jgi:hypothetical protein
MSYYLEMIHVDSTAIRAVGYERQHAPRRVPQREGLRPPRRSVFGLRRPDGGNLEGAVLLESHPGEIQVNPMKSTFIRVHSRSRSRIAR